MTITAPGRLLRGRAGRRIRMVDWLWSGALGADGFAVAAELLAATTGVSLMVSESPLLAPLSLQTAAINTVALSGDGGDTYHVARFDVTGLSAGRTYYFALAVDGAPDRGNIGRIRTAPTALAASSFRVVIGSCTNPGSSDPDDAFQAIEAEAPLLFVHLGDLHYDDIATNDLPKNRTAIRKHTRLAKVASCYRTAPIAYIYDDHDAGPNDAHQDTAGFTSFMGNTLTAYRDLVPHYPLAQPDLTGWARGNAQMFTIGRVRFLIPDLRTFRNQVVNPKTTLGDGRTTSGFVSWDQKQWVLDQLSQAQTDGIKLLVLLSSSTIPGTIGGSWEVEFAAEFADLMTFAAANDVPEVLLVSGDGHAFGFDDGGVVASLAPASQARLLHVQSSPLRSNALALAGPFSWLGNDSETNTVGSGYVVFDFSDSGGNRVTWTATPKDSSGVAFAGAKGGPFASDDTGRMVQLAVSSSNVAENAGAIALTVTKSWVGTCAVAYATADGSALAGTDYTATSGTLTFKANQAAATISVPIANRAGAQGSRDFTLTLSSPGDCTLGATTQTTVTITDV